MIAADGELTVRLANVGGNLGQEFVWAYAAGAGQPGLLSNPSPNYLRDCFSCAFKQPLVAGVEHQLSSPRGSAIASQARMACRPNQGWAGSTLPVCTRTKSILTCHAMPLAVPCHQAACIWSVFLSLPVMLLHQSLTKDSTSVQYPCAILSNHAACRTLSHHGKLATGQYPFAYLTGRAARSSLLHPGRPHPGSPPQSERQSPRRRPVQPRQPCGTINV